MDATQQATALLTQSKQLLLLRAPNAAYQQAAQRQAVTISDFLSSNGEALDQTRPDLVTNLGLAVDAFAKDTAELSSTVMQSPAAAFMDSLKKDAGKTGGDVKEMVTLAIILLVAIAIVK